MGLVCLPGPTFTLHLSQQNQLNAGNTPYMVWECMGYIQFDPQTNSQQNGESRSKSETGTSESPFFGLWNTLQRFPTYLDTAMDHMDQSNSPVVFRTGWAIKGLWIPNSTVQFDDSPDAKVEPTRETMSPWSGEETKSCSVPWMETFIEKNEFQFQLGTLAGIGAFFQKIRFFERFLRSGAWGNFPPLLKTTNHFWVRSRNFGSCHVGLGPVPWSPLPPKVHRAS